MKIIPFYRKASVNWGFNLIALKINIYKFTTNRYYIFLILLYKRAVI